jgi:hypothetical protein
MKKWQNVSAPFLKADEKYVSQQKLPVCLFVDICIFLSLLHLKYVT